MTIDSILGGLICHDPTCTILYVRGLDCDDALKGLPYALAMKMDIWMGCVSTMFAATKTSKSGEYICPPAVPEKGSDQSQDEELGERLMKLTRDVIKEKTYADSAAKGCPFQDY